MENRGYEVEAKENEERSTGKKILTILLICLSLFLFGCCLGCYIYPDAVQEVTQNLFNLEVDDNISDDGIDNSVSVDDLNAKVAEGMITITISSNPSAVGRDVYLGIENVESNNYPQIVEITLEDGTLVYQSGLIPIGSYVNYGELLVDLEAGDYACTAMFNSINEATATSAGSAGVNITLTVE